jgi:hypothetical protein
MNASDGDRSTDRASNQPAGEPAEVSLAALPEGKGWDELTEQDFRDLAKVICDGIAGSQQGRVTERTRGIA